MYGNHRMDITSFLHKFIISMLSAGQFEQNFILKFKFAGIFSDMYLSAQNVCLPIML